MSARFWVGIVCNDCGKEFAGRAETDRTEYLEALTAVRASAARVGWRFSKGHRNRSIDRCKPCVAAWRAALREAG